MSIVCEVPVGMEGGKKRQNDEEPERWEGASNIECGFVQLAHLFQVVPREEDAAGGKDKDAERRRDVLRLGAVGGGGDAALDAAVLSPGARPGLLPRAPLFFRPHLLVRLLDVSLDGIKDGMILPVSLVRRLLEISWLGEHLHASMASISSSSSNRSAFHPVTPVDCARRGFRLEEADLIRCVACPAALSGRLASSDVAGARDRSVQALRENLGRIPSIPFSYFIC